MLRTGTDLSTPLAFTNFLFLPVTYSMIFHRDDIPPFSYADDRNDWNGTCRDGRMQSPIHIRTPDAVRDEEAQPILFINYDLANLEASLAKHTIKFDVKPQWEGLKIGIAGGGLMGFYYLDHIHLHWSHSEHSIDDTEYAMEAHLVHFKTPHGNQSIDDAIDEPDGIAVVAVLFTLGSADKVLDDLIMDLGRNHTNAKIPLSPKTFLPDDMDEYIRYKGSLTTPPCSEVVVWTIFTTPKTVTQYQVNWLRSRKLSEGYAESNNARTPQPINDREITLMTASYSYNSVHHEHHKGIGNGLVPCIHLILAFILLSAFHSC